MELTLMKVDSSHSFSRSTISEAVQSAFKVSQKKIRYSVAASILGVPFVTHAMPASFSLSDLDGSNGFVINGINVGDGAGGAVSSAGDVNGDGFDDVLIGAAGSDVNGNLSGQGYLVFGGSAATPNGILELSSLIGTDGITFNGVDTVDLAGVSVGAAGDVNNDGVDDLVIGAPRAGSGGQSYVVFGGPTLSTNSPVELSSLDGTNGFSLDGDFGGRTGRSVSSAGDVNGDGVDDLLIGDNYADPNGSNSGRVYLVFGGTGLGATGSIDLASLSGGDGLKLNGAETQDYAGQLARIAGDLNGDGFNDIIIGIGRSNNPNAKAGKSYVVFGGTSLNTSNLIELSSLDGTNGYVVNGIDDGDQSSFALSAAGDVNNDGIDDLLIGAHTANPNGDRSGESYIIFGGSNVGTTGVIPLANLDGSDGFIINGVSTGEISGRSVSGAGDFNGDGIDDFVIGATFASPAGVVFGGATYVVYGAAGIGSNGIFELSGLDGSNGFTIGGANNVDKAGSSVSAAKDVNGDGFDDLVIGASSASPNGSGSGAAYVVFGAPSPSFCNSLTVTVNLNLGQTPTSDDDVILGTLGADIINALAGNDTICSEGGDDIINAGPGDDWVDAGDGDDRVFGLDGADIINGGLGADEIVSGNGNDLINGDDGNDVLNGGPGDDIVSGGSGDDTIFGQGGNDLLNGEDGNDFIIGVGGEDEINGGAGNDILNGGPDNDTINGGDGEDVVFGLSGDDTLDGGLGDDQVFGQPGADTVTGGGGNDRLFGNEGDDVITATSGTNVINGGPGNDTLTGGSGEDSIFGDGNLLQAGDDIIDGGAGVDLIVGFAGQDTITSTDGEADTVNGGPDFDVCTTDGIDTVFNCP